MAVRDRILPALNRANAIIASLGLRRTAVKIRKRTWDGSRIDDTNGNTPGYTDVVTVLTPTPEVTMMSPYAAQMAGLMTAGGDIEDRYLKIGSITPQFVDPADNQTKGYTPGQLRQLVTPGAQNVQIDIIITGDDGVERVTKLVATDFTDPFEYTLTVRLRARDA